MPLFRVLVTTKSFKWTCIVEAPTGAAAAHRARTDMGGEITETTELRNPVFVVSYTRIREEVPL